MPLFEYRCAQCGVSHEVLVRAEETPACPECGSKRMEKQASHFAPMSAAAASAGPACQGCGGAGSCPMRG